MSKTCRYAVVFTAIGFIFALTAMAAPYWLQNDGEVRDAKFQNLGKSIRSSGCVTTTMHYSFCQNLSEF